MPSRTLLLIGALAVLVGCATTPTHIPGEVPRDANGRPILSLIEPTSAAATR